MPGLRPCLRPRLRCHRQRRAAGMAHRARSHAARDGDRCPRTLVMREWEREATLGRIRPYPVSRLENPRRVHPLDADRRAARPRAVQQHVDRGLSRCDPSPVNARRMRGSCRRQPSASLRHPAASGPGGCVRLTAWSPWGPNRCRISTASAWAGPNQCGVPVSNSATSPGRRIVSLVPRMRRSSCGEDVEPFVAGVGHQLRFAVCEYLFEDLDAARVLRERDEDASPFPAAGGEVDAGIAGGRRRHQLVQCDAMGAGERDEEVEVGRRRLIRDARACSRRYRCPPREPRG